MPEMLFGLPGYVPYPLFGLEVGDEPSGDGHPGSIKGCHERSYNCNLPR